MTADDAVALRKRLGITQGELASRLGMTTRAWQEVESGKKAKVRPIHALALERVALDIALADQNADRLPDRVQRLVLGVAGLVEPDADDAM